jgi:hypothetical protein
LLCFVLFCFVSERTDYDQSYGAFFPTGSEQMWVQDALLRKKTMKMHGFLNKQTTDATVYLVTRNLDADALFYTLVKVSFEFRVNGYSNVKYKAVFSPMIQYEYGTDGYGWRNRQMYVWEIMFLILFGGFVLREVYQVVFSRIVPFVKRVCGRAPVAPAVSADGQDRHCDGAVARAMTPPEAEKMIVSSHDDRHDKDKEKDKDAAGDAVQDLEKGHSGHSDISTIPMKEPAADSVSVNANTNTNTNINANVKRPPMIDLNNDGKDDFEQLGHFMHDLNDNGIDDEEELRELLDEYLPDAAGLLDILDWLTIGIVALSIYYRLDYIAKTADLHEFFKELAEEKTYKESMTEIINSFAAIDENLAVMNTLVMILVFFGIVQFFRYLSFDKRLGIVTATIKESLGSLLPVLLIFMVVMFSYAVLGTVMYGAHLSSWSNIGKSASQLFLLILGEFGSYFDIMQINPLLSAVYFWSYIIMALFLLFNMVLAVIFTVYDEKNTEIMELEAAEKAKKKEKEESKKDK